MSILVLSEAKAQVRITSTAEDALLQGYLDAAEGHVARFLNRNLYPDQNTLNAAIAAVPDALTAAQAAYDAASTAWLTADDQTQIPVQEAWAKAIRDQREAVASARRTYGGMTLNAPIQQAILLLFGHFCNNREAVVVDLRVKSAIVDLGVQTLLEQWRIGEGV